MPNKVSKKLNRAGTFADIDARFRLQDKQKQGYE